MNNTNKILLILLALVVAAGLYVFVSAPPSDDSEITSFEACAAAGYPILESYPEQCRTPSGKVFTRIIVGAVDEEEAITYRTIQLYYYNPTLDTDENGNILCSQKGIVSVERKIPLGQTPIQDAIRLLLRGEITPHEETQGITSEFPLEGLTLTGASLREGVLTLGFDDPKNATSGGSCRAGILWFQIEATARQFDEVEDVQFQPEELFQP